MKALEVVMALLKKDGHKDVQATDRLMADLGLDSLDYAVLMLQVETSLGVKITENDVIWSQVQTVAQLADLFDRQAK